MKRRDLLRRLRRVTRSKRLDWSIERETYTDERGDEWTRVIHTSPLGVRNELVLPVAAASIEQWAARWCDQPARQINDARDELQMMEQINETNGSTNSSIGTNGSSPPLLH